MDPILRARVIKETGEIVVAICVAILTYNWPKICYVWPFSKTILLQVYEGSNTRAIGTNTRLSNGRLVSVTRQTARNCNIFLRVIHTIIVYILIKTVLMVRPRA